VDAFGPGFFNVQQVKKLANDCRNYNFNAVLVEMRRRGDAFYDSKFDPRTTIITTNFDALAEIIKECHTGVPRIEVHCWLVSHFIWAWEKPPRQPDHIFNRHPEYLTRDSIGQKFIGKGYFLDPGNPDANQTIYNVAKDIVSRYDLDGLHWDYCRYPNRDSGYNETALKRFNEEGQPAPHSDAPTLQRSDAPRPRPLAPQPAPDDPKFCEWRRRQVTDLLRWVNADLWELKPNLVISASVFANIHDSYGYRFADWPAWCKEGIIDAVMPMDFSADNRGIFFPRADAALTNLASRHIYLGQAAYLNTRENTLEQLNYAREKGFPGIVLYDYRHPNSGAQDPAGVFSFLHERFQPVWTATPPLRWKQSRGIIKGIATRRSTGKPIYNAVITINTDRVLTQRTEPHGAFAFSDLKPGRYLLRTQAGETNTASATVELTAGHVLHLALNL
jgi:uncharacterized lipoprotein YddW (UPF0748 family)